MKTRTGLVAGGPWKESAQLSHNSIKVLAVLLVQRCSAQNTFARPEPDLRPAAWV